MKFQKTIIVLFFLCLTQFSFGQTAAGRVQIGGGFNASFNKTDFATFYSFSTSASLGYFFSDHIILNAGLSYSFSKSNSSNTDDTRHYGSLDIGTRYYWKGETVQPFLGICPSYCTE